MHLKPNPDSPPTTQEDFCAREQWCSKLRPLLVADPEDPSRFKVPPGMEILITPSYPTPDPVSAAHETWLILSDPAFLILEHAGRSLVPGRLYVPWRKLRSVRYTEERG